MPRGEKYRDRPDSWTVMVTWLPSMTLRSERPCRNVGATGLLGDAGRKYLPFPSLFFSVDGNRKRDEHSLIPQTQTKLHLAHNCEAEGPTSPC